MWTWTRQLCAQEGARQWRYDDLVRRMIDKEVLMEWLIEGGLLAKSELCPQCNKEMKLVTCNDRSDGLKWKCRMQTSGDGGINIKEREAGFCKAT